MHNLRNEAALLCEILPIALASSVLFYYTYPMQSKIKIRRRPAPIPIVHGSQLPSHRFVQAQFVDTGIYGPLQALGRQVPDMRGAGALKQVLVVNDQLDEGA